MTSVDTDGPEGRDRRAERGFGLVETLVALLVLSVGMLGVAGLTGSVAKQTRRASWETEQALVAQQVMDSIRQAGYAAAADGADTLQIAGRQWAAAWTVTEPAPTLKRVDVDVDGRRELSARTYTARLHRPLALASAKPPQSGGGGGGDSGGDGGDDGGDDDDEDDGPIELPEDMPPGYDEDDLCPWWIEDDPNMQTMVYVIDAIGFPDLADEVEQNWGQAQSEINEFCD